MQARIADRPLAPFRTNSAFPRTVAESEVAVADGIRRLEQENRDRSPEGIQGHLIEDLLVVLRWGASTAAELRPVKSLPAEKERYLVRQVRPRMIETALNKEDGGRLQ